MIRQRNINIVFVLLFTAYTVYSVFFRQAGFFFIIYLFWFDEVIRNCSLLIQLRLRRKDEPEKENIVLTRGRSTVFARFFFLFVYAVFIIIVFGIFFNLDKALQDKLYENLRIMSFIDPVFNICLCIALVREIILIRAVHQFKLIPDVGHAMDGHILTLHLSMILGGLLFALTSEKMHWLNISLGPLNPYLLILPFLVIKFIVDMRIFMKEDVLKQSS